MVDPRKARRGRVRLVVWLVLAITAAVVWRFYFTQPSETKRSLYQGIAYERRVLQKPRPIVIHLLVIDTRAPGLRFLVTPPDRPGDEKPLLGRTTSEFLRDHHLQIAINADFYYPWKSTVPWDYYPHHHDPVTVEGDAVSEGVRYAERDQKTTQETLYLSKTNRPSFVLPKGEKPWNAVGGHTLLRNGVSSPRSHYDETVPDPRTAVGYSPDGNTLYLVCVDGRQTGYSDGMTIVELDQFFRSLGIKDAINLDGGGSTALVMEEGKNARVLNRPIDQRFPGKERYVANHLGIYAEPIRE